MQNVCTISSRFVNAMEPVQANARVLILNCP